MSGKLDRQARTATVGRFAAVMGVIFFCEAAVMTILHAFNVRGLWDIVLDPLLLSVLTGPFLLWMLAGSRAGKIAPPEHEDGTPGGRSSRWRASAAIGGLVVITAMVLVGLRSSHASYERQVTGAFQQRQLVTARSIAASAEEIVDEVTRDLEYLARDTDIIDITPDAQQEIESFRSTHSGVMAALAIVDAEGNTVRWSPPSAEPPDVSTSRAFAEMRDTRGAGSVKATQDRTDDVQVMRVFAPIRREGKFVGAVCGVIDLPKFWKKCLTGTEAGPRTSCWVVDDEGVIVHDTRGRFTGRTWAQVEQQWHAEDSRAKEEDEAAEEALRDRVRRGEEGVASCWSSPSEEVELVAFTPIHLVHRTYGLAIVTPGSEVSGPIQAHARVTYGLMLGMLLFLAMAGYVSLRGVRARAQLLAGHRHAAQRKRAAKQIASLARFPDENPNPVLRVAPDGVILYSNHASRSLLEVWGCREDRRLPDEWHKLVVDTLAAGRSREVEAQCDERSLLLTFAPIGDSDYVNVYALDVTERKRAEEQTHIAREKAERANEELARWAEDLDSARGATLNLAEDLEHARAETVATNRQLEAAIENANLMAAEAEVGSAAKSEFLAN
ncbi:hypothetical protein LCGC14_2104120, partial [marine sediment metagenome]